MRIISVCAMLLSLTISAQAEEKPFYAVAPKHQTTEAFKADVYETSDAILFSIPEKKVQYYITKSNNPAYPAVIENEIIGRRDEVRFKANSFAAPDNKNVAKWLEKIDKINKERLAKLKAQ